MSDLIAVILAAGKGTRMKSRLPKVMHQLAGKPLIDHVLDNIEKAGIKKTLTVVGHGRETVTEHIRERSGIVLQEEQLGTGHALRQVLPWIKGEKSVLVLSGDQPLLTCDTINSLIDIHEKSQAAATILTAVVEKPYGYGRIIRENGFFKGIVEEKDADADQKAIKVINAGTYCFEVSSLCKALEKVRPQNNQGEYYLTDVFTSLLAAEEKIETLSISNSMEALGINNRVQLAEAEDVFFDRIRKYWMMEGVSIINPSSVFIDASVTLARDVVIHPFTIIRGNTTIEEGAVIGPGTTIEDCYCQQFCRIENSVARQAVIGEESIIGPFAYLRPKTKLAKGVKVGDFVEIKNSHIGEGSKIPHLSYIGDSTLGKNVNIGAGTITCNYDGKSKHDTIIGDNAFVGSNTNFVAPVRIGEKTVIGAGSTITKDVPANALAVERSAQKNIENWQKAKKN